jgi:GTPase KRas
MWSQNSKGFCQLDRAMTGQWANLGDGYLMAYPINHRESFIMLEKWTDDLLHMSRKESLPIMVLGTKCDLTYRREVTTAGLDLYTLYYEQINLYVAEGRAFAAKVNALHIETSAKSDINVEAAFVDLVKLIREREKVCVVQLTIHST